MHGGSLTALGSYNPDHLLDALIQHLELKNDAELSRVLGVAPPVISKIRHKRVPVGPTMLIAMHEASSLSIRQLRELMGDRRDSFLRAGVLAQHGDPHCTEMSTPGGKQQRPGPRLSSPIQQVPTETATAV